MPVCLPETGAPSNLTTAAILGIALLLAGVGIILLARHTGGGRRALAVAMVVGGVVMAATTVGVSAGFASTCQPERHPSSAATSAATDDPTDDPTSEPTPSPSTSPSTNPTPTPTPTPTDDACNAVSDKSPTADTDGDGTVDACDLDSDNDGILDSEEDINTNGRFEDDDVDGDRLLIAVIGDGISSYLDLDSDNDSVLDLMEGRPLTTEQIDEWDSDHDGVLDSGLTFGKNGLADVLETSPDSGVLRAEFRDLRNDDGDDRPNYLDLKSNGPDFDLYRVDNADLDELGGGFISRLSDPDRDGIQAVVDSAPTRRGAPGSPYAYVP